MIYFSPLWNETRACGKAKNSLLQSETICSESAMVRSIQYLRVPSSISGVGKHFFSHFQFSKPSKVFEMNFIVQKSIFESFCQMKGKLLKIRQCLMQIE